jgi:hypothetical protein
VCVVTAEPSVSDTNQLARFSPTFANMGVAKAMGLGGHRPSLGARGQGYQETRGRGAYEGMCWERMRAVNART